eukprot:SAG31_NODE_17598_length_665_cov_0.729682_2_plen_88_part_01
MSVNRCSVMHTDRLLVPSHLPAISSARTTNEVAASKADVARACMPPRSFRPSDSFDRGGQVAQQKLQPRGWQGELIGGGGRLELSSYM